MIFRLISESLLVIILDEKGIEKPGVECVNVHDPNDPNDDDNTRVTVTFEDGREQTCVIHTTLHNNKIVLTKL